MQNQQMAAMAGMNPVNMGGPVDGTPVMGNAPRPKGSQDLTPDPRTTLNTYIYDYFRKNSQEPLARMMLECNLGLNLNNAPKRSPGSRNVNGVADESKDELPAPALPDTNLAENSFLLDWWVQFWDIWTAARLRNSNPTSTSYIQHSRKLAQMSTNERNQRMMMSNGGMNPNYPQMMRMPNGAGTPNDLKRQVLNQQRNPGAGPMGNMNQMKNPALMSAQMQRDGSQMDMNGQRPQSPGSAENAPSPNKRARVEGMNPANMAGNQFGEFAQPGPAMQQKALEGMNTVQGSPLNQQLEGHTDVFAGNQPRPGMPPAPGPPQGNHALQDYQMQLMLLEQQNKKRLLMARQEQDNMSGGPPHGQAAVGAPGFPPAMSPQGSRAGPSPNPTEQMKRGTPKIPQQGLPGSPMPDGTMPQQRNSPAPMAFEQMPPGMPPQFPYPQMPQNGMMRPPSSHPVFNGQQMNPQQMEAMRQGGMQNGVPWRGPGGQPMMGAPGQPMQNPMQNPQQRQMPPPPAPAGEQPRQQEPSPSQPAAPPTPQSQNKANPKKKTTKDNKKPAKAKGATGATPAASGEETAPTPTPATPITPVHKPFNAPNGQSQPAQPPVQQSAQPPQQNPMDNGPFGEISGDDFGISGMGFDANDTLDNFDFDSFLHVGGDDSGFGSLGNDFGFGDGVEAGGEI
ncbi:hypothetical protein EJ04DRAFT_183548 [Polyplosphaeria fusca]|uniref:LisH domain-containing protein n=1 Tax=Polyplosphaeria fusca TaxID=682080 RepID=A0A9P4V2L2_9PLEO|nr:hypothetical protein EJ04DRAFT_183548 [Polyplosphaeria fusca]